MVRHCLQNKQITSKNYKTYDSIIYLINIIVPIISYIPLARGLKDTD